MSILTNIDITHTHNDCFRNHPGLIYFWQNCSRKLRKAKKWKIYCLVGKDVITSIHLLLFCAIFLIKFTRYVPESVFDYTFIFTTHCPQPQYENSIALLRWRTFTVARFRLNFRSEFSSFKFLSSNHALLIMSIYSNVLNTW